MRAEHFPSLDGVEKVILMQNLVHHRFYLERNRLEFVLTKHRRDMILVMLIKLDNSLEYFFLNLGGLFGRLFLEQREHLRELVEVQFVDIMAM